MTIESQQKNPVIEQLLAQIAREPKMQKFRRRAVLSDSSSDWMLLCCVVESMTPDESIVSTSSRVYPSTVLFEDILQVPQLLDFVEKIQEGSATFGKITTTLEPSSWYRPDDWQIYMKRSGVVFTASVARNNQNRLFDKLVTAEQPYYPDTYEAARHWLGLAVYHGSSDARNGQILFHFPQVRAFIRNVAFQTNGQLLVELDGTALLEGGMRLKGAYWLDQQIHHLDSAVEDRRVVLDVSKNADRLDLVLIDKHDEVFDSQSDRRMNSVDGGRNAFSGSAGNLSEQIKLAAQEGEGLLIEFKPFIQLARKSIKEKSGKNDDHVKLKEVIRTVAAFANCQGGAIYLGITDECQIEGVNQKVRAWAESDLEEALNQYRGALLQAIRDQMHGGVDLSVSVGQVDDRAIVIVMVEPADPEIVAITDDYTLYVRSGGTNRKVMPDDWPSLRKRKVKKREQLVFNE